MNSENINEVITEISNLNNQRNQLSDKLVCGKILSNFLYMKDNIQRNKYTLIKSYDFIKQIQHEMYDSLYENDVNNFVPLFTVMEKLEKSWSMNMKSNAQLIQR